jgi:hypothetical protein
MPEPFRAFAEPSISENSPIEPTIGHQLPWGT